MKYKILTFLAIIAFGSRSFAQIGTPVSQFSGNQMIYNPAYSGIYDILSVNLHMRQSWVNLPGAPQLISLNAHAPFKNSRHAMGGIYQIERWGPLTDHLVHANYSHKIQFSRGVLSLGIQAGVLVNQIDWSDMRILDPDPFREEGRQSSVKFDGNVGLYYLARSWYAGFSVMRMNTMRYGEVNVNGLNYYSQMRSQWIGIAGYNFDINELWSFRPEIFMRYVHTAPFITNIGLHAFYMNLHSVGVSFLTGQSTIPGISFQGKATILDHLRVGYSYNVYFGELRHHQQGSHEISLNYIIRNIWGRDRTVDL